VEKMRSLRRVDFHVFESGFDNHFCTGDLIPLHRYAQPWIEGTPTANSDEEIGPFLRQELFVEFMTSYAASLLLARSNRSTSTTTIS